MLDCVDKAELSVLGASDELFSIEADWLVKLDELSMLEIGAVVLEDSIEVAIELLLMVLEDSGIC
ncbi:MAG: hypothetical protein HWN81_20950 [Candidatus Lokiarchaeota archaeon]|nr:hypothetical protein [Candidatus Lokiarchaeota archaeon]